MRILVLVLSCPGEPWRTIEHQGQRATWAGGDHPDVPVRFYYGVRHGRVYWSTRIGSGALRALRMDRARAAFDESVGRRAAGWEVEAGGADIRTAVPESYVHTNAKLRAALRHLLSVDRFDYLFRTNTAAYVDLPRLRAFASTLPAGGYYGGFVGELDGLSYASGTGILLSRDLVEACVDDREWRFDRVDDVALGLSMRRAGVRPRPLPRLRVAREDDVVTEELRRLFLVWCRSSRSRSRLGAGREASRDVALMRRVHDAYGALKGVELDAV